MCRGDAALSEHANNQTRNLGTRTAAIGGTRSVPTTSIGFAAILRTFLRTMQIAPLPPRAATWPSRASQFTAKVALKLIKLGIGGREIVARFQAEFRALALMSHSNIARFWTRAREYKDTHIIVWNQGRPY